MTVTATGPLFDGRLTAAVDRAIDQAGHAGQGDNAREFTGRGIRELEADARQAHGRMMRTGAV